MPAGSVPQPPQRPDRHEGRGKFVLIVVVLAPIGLVLYSTTLNTEAACRQELASFGFQC